ncbi:hypothetical protein [Helicobacter sp. T3_23-1056]
MKKEINTGISRYANLATQTRERERESNSTLNLPNSKSLNSCNDGVVSASIADSQASYSPSLADLQTSCPPSLAEGARGWVSLDSTADIIGKDSTSIADNDSTSVIASKSQDLRGNPQDNIETIDCHALDSAKTQNLIARNDGNAKSCNDTHPQTPSAREGAFNSPSKSSLRANEVSVAIHDLNKIDCHADFDKSARNDDNVKSCNGNAKSFNDRIFTSIADSQASCSPSLAEGARGWVNKNTKPKKRLALSLATSAFIAGLATIDSAVAACVWAEDWSRGDANSHGIGYYSKVDCTGYTTADAVSSSARTVLNGGGYYRHSRLNLNGSVGDGTVTLQFSSNGWNDRGGFSASNTTRELRFNSTSASGTTFNVSNSTTAPTNVDIYSSGSTNVGGLTLSAGTIRNVNLSGGSFGNITVSNGATASNMSLSNGIGVGAISNSGTIGTMSLTNGINVGAISNTGNITSLTINGENANVGAINGTNGTIGTLTLGSANNHNPISNTNIQNTVNTLLIHGASVTIASGNDWNTVNNGSRKEQHITIAGGCTTATCMGASPGSITIYISDGADRTVEYKLENLVVSGTTAIGTSLSKRHIALDAEDRSGRGTKLIFTNNGKSFRLEPDGGDAYITDVYRAAIMSNLRRNAMTQNILDTMTTKTFHSDRYYNQEVDLRLLQYEMSRLTNRSSKFNKQKRKNERKIDKVREKIAKLTLDQSKGQDLDKGYNNFELIDQLDAIFIPYNGRRDWRLFALPYASHTYGFVASNETQEFAGGAILGIQRNLRKSGIFGGYVGYEFASTDTYLRGSQTNIYNNSLQVGLNYYKSFAITAKVMEGFIKANIRASADLPQFRFQAAGKLNTIESNEKGISMPLVASGGAELRGGVTFYNFKRNSYIAPDISLSYDTFYGVKMRFDKPFIPTDSTKLYPIGGDEKYGSVLWHLPQVGLSVRHYAIWGNTFRTNVKAGIKYNILNKQKLGSFSLAGQEDYTARYISLPKVYGNLAFDMIWMIKKNHELSLGYDGLFFASSFEKKNGLHTEDWFNGITTTVNLKYAYWFGGTDYVTDKDGNAVSRSVVEGGKSKKSKSKSKKKKGKKSKKKVYYIDG